MINSHKIVSMIAAAGIGSRFGGKIPKQYHTILGKPMLYHSVKVLRNHKKIEQIYILLSPKDPFSNLSIGVSSEKRLFPYMLGMLPERKLSGMGY